MVISVIVAFRQLQAMKLKTEDYRNYKYRELAFTDTLNIVAKYEDIMERSTSKYKSGVLPFLVYLI